MNLTDIANIRIINQQIQRSKFRVVKEIVDWMGAMQAQDYAMAKWAIGLRLPNSTNQEIEAAINNAEIIRTHLLRPTWHFVSSDDIFWMLELTAPQIKATMKSRRNQLGLSETIYAKSNTIIENALRGGKHLIREDLLAELGKAKIALDENRASHLLVQAELDGIVCSGSIKGGKQTYALLDERIPRTKTFIKDEALAKLAKKYFTSHGPATLQDFTWWSGLSVSDARKAIENVKSDFIPERINSQIYWFPSEYSTPKGDEGLIFPLPAFDEFIIGYTDRRATLGEDLNKIVISNGVFRPVIVVSGHVTGIWKRMIRKDKVSVEIGCFRKPDITTKNLIEKAFQQYGRFLEKEMEIGFV